MLNIKSSESCMHHLPLLRKWFEAEWGEVDPFDTQINGSAVPLPIVAVNKGELVGGLAFTRFPCPQSSSQALWVNALLVDPGYRNQGISSLLIKAAESLGSQLGETHLYSYTDIPHLYIKQNWVVVEESGSHFVLSKSVIKG